MKEVEELGCGLWTAETVPKAELGERHAEVTEMRQRPCRIRLQYKGAPMGNGMDTKVWSEERKPDLWNPKFPFSIPWLNLRAPPEADFAAVLEAARAFVQEDLREHCLGIAGGASIFMLHELEALGLQFEGETMDGSVTLGGVAKDDLLFADFALCVRQIVPKLTSDDVADIDLCCVIV